MSSFTRGEDSKKVLFKDINPYVTRELILRNSKLVNIEGIERFKFLKKIDFVNIQLASLPESIGDLSELKELDLHKNHLTSLPESIGNLSNLRDLRINDNRLTSLPESIGNLSNLRDLVLNDNRLTSLPESFGNLTNLRNLSLQNNRLTSLPESFGNLSKLEIVHLQNNQLTSLPESIRNFTQNIFIFIGSGVSLPDNLPGNIRVIRSVERQTVDPVQVHREVAKIDYDKLIDVLKNKTTGEEIDTTKIDYPKFINEKMMDFIEKSTDKSEDEKEKNKEGLELIMNTRLRNLNYSILPKSTKEYIVYVLEYVGLQPQAFKDIYVTAFVSDCLQAYPGKGNEAMTCATGALERILLSLQTAFVSTSEKDEKKAEYNEISNIITSTKSKKDLGLEQIQNWYASHKIGTPGEFPEGTSLEEKKASLKAYLKEKFPSPEDEKFVDDQVEIAEYGITFADNAFTYSQRAGRKRRTRKMRKARKAGKGKSVKKQIKKSRKSKKQGKRSKKSHK